MPKFGQILQEYFYSFIYALGITIAIYISIEELHKFNNANRFISFSIIIFAILLIENIIAVVKRNKEIEINLDINDKVNELWHFFYKFLMPFLYFISLVIFGYYNLYSNSILIVLTFTFFTFFILFINTRAFFQNIKKLESRTHYVYDLIKFLLFFTGVNSFSHFYLQNTNLIIPISVGVGVLSFLLVLLMIWRINKIQMMGILFSIIVGIALSVIFGALNLTNMFNTIQISLGLLFVFYLSVAIIHHALLNTLTKSVLFEYLVILGVIFTVIYGIT